MKSLALFFATVVAILLFTAYALTLRQERDSEKSIESRLYSACVLVIVGNAEAQTTAKEIRAEIGKACEHDAGKRSPS